MKKRIESLDFLRGFAIVAILLLHNLEHFDYYYIPKCSPDWLLSLDQKVWSVLFWLFAGKAYAIFALLFGVTFYIQNKNQTELGRDFRGRFAWRLVLLFGFGMLNSCFFQGDILTLYALLGFVLIFVPKIPEKLLLFLAFFLLLQPVEIARTIYLFWTAPESIPNPTSWAYFGKMSEYIPESSFWNTVWGNLTNGKLAVYNWTWEAGRVFQTPALFILGFLLAKANRFVESVANRQFWLRVLAVSGLIFCIGYGIELYFEGEKMVWLRSFNVVIGTITKVAFTFIWIAVLLQLFWYTKARFVLEKFAVLGRMSLTNYVMQSVLGATIYYGFGLKLYQYTGATLSLLIAVVLAVLQWYFCHYWLKTHKRGVLEQIWHRATWLKMPF